MRAFAVAVALVVTGGVASANPLAPDDPRVVLVAADEVKPPPPPPVPREPTYTWLGMRIGAGKLPIGGHEVTAVGFLQVTGDIELTRRTRVFGEYEFLLLSAAGPDPMGRSLSGFGHRANLGLSRELAGITPNREVHLSITAEAGVGAAAISGDLGERVLPHAFAGGRAGFAIFVDKHLEHSPAFCFELLIRGIALREGLGLLFGLGLSWGQ